ncbi:unnamed protein product [Cutaneotrichosporon oleaginosum]
MTAVRGRGPQCGERVTLRRVDNSLAPSPPQFPSAPPHSLLSSFFTFQPAPSKLAISTSAPLSSGTNILAPEITESHQSMQG